MLPTRCATWRLPLCGPGEPARTASSCAATDRPTKSARAGVGSPPDGERRADAGRELYPDGSAGDEARSLVRRFADELGPASRRVIWRHLINDLGLACRYWEQGLGEGQARFQRITTRFAKRPIRQAMNLSPDELDAAPGTVRSQFDEVAEKIAVGGRIVGDSVTAADLAFAAMASPAVLPPEGYPVRMPQPADFPEDVAETVRELRAHPAGEYALRMYREERAVHPEARRYR